ncbi:dihydrofolate reductase family protein [Leifsonia sp. 2MCAF36]|uniref:dihydrofolate reductase family protein n=1 Tax=Leifsonia sp. 2MCAF36 TaxID=3232988 RepID=UPI003F95904B
MGRLIFAAITSVDGYTVDASGSFDWAAPDAEVHAFVNDLERGVGTYLYGRRMYETMRVWQDFPGAEDHPVTADYAAIWRNADKIVYSSTLTEASTPRTSVQPRFDADEVRSLIRSSDRDLSIGGPTLAAAAFAAGLVDEVRLIAVPVSVGGGTPALPAGQRLQLELLDERRFTGGTIALHYAVQH